MRGGQFFFFWRCAAAYSAFIPRCFALPYLFIVFGYLNASNLVIIGKATVSGIVLVVESDIGDTT